MLFHVLALFCLFVNSPEAYYIELCVIRVPTPLIGGEKAHESKSRECKALYGDMYSIIP